VLNRKFTTFNSRTNHSRDVVYNAENPPRIKNIILFLLLTNSIYGQNLELISDVELCEQIQLATEYLKADKELKTRNFRFDSKIGNGWNYDGYFLTEYVAQQLGIEKEKVFEFDKTKTYPIFNKLDNISREISELELDCLKKKRKPNAVLSKLGNDNLLINVTTNRVGKEGANGIAYLFFFENGKILKVYKTSWIE